MFCVVMGGSGTSCADDEWPVDLTWLEKDSWCLL